MTLSVAVATRQAIEAGLVAAPGRRGGAVGIMKQRLKAVAALTAVQKRLEQTLTREAMSALPDFFVLVIESETWGFFRPTLAGFDPNIRPEAPRLTAEDPRERDAVVILSEAAARRISAGELPFARCCRPRPRRRRRRSRAARGADRGLAGRLPASRLQPLCLCLKAFARPARRRWPFAGAAHVDEAAYRDDTVARTSLPRFRHLELDNAGFARHRDDHSWRLEGDLVALHAREIDPIVADDCFG